MGHFEFSPVFATIGLTGCSYDVKPLKNQTTLTHFASLFYNQAAFRISVSFDHELGVKDVSLTPPPLPREKPFGMTMYMSFLQGYGKAKYDQL